MSESFIEKHLNKLNLNNIIKYQKLSKDFINKYKDNFDINYIIKYQKLSEDFIKNNNFYIKDNWLYKDVEFKKEMIKRSALYKCYDDYFIAFKPIRRDRYSLYNFQYKYEPNKVYESNCDCTNKENSFGLNVGSYRYAEKYGTTNIIIVKCKIRYEDVGRLVYCDEKIRCFKIEILE